MELASYNSRRGTGYKRVFIVINLWSLSWSRRLGNERYVDYSAAPLIHRCMICQRHSQRPRRDDRYKTRLSCSSVNGVDTVDNGIWRAVTENLVIMLQTLDNEVRLRMDYFAWRCAGKTKPIGRCPSEIQLSTEKKKRSSTFDYYFNDSKNVQLHPLTKNWPKSKVFFIATVHGIASTIVFRCQWSHLHFLSCVSLICTWKEQPDDLFETHHCVNNSQN